MGCTFRAKQLEDRGGLEEVEKLGQKTSDEKRERHVSIWTTNKQKQIPHPNDALFFSGNLQLMIFKMSHLFNLVQPTQEKIAKKN